MDARLQGTRFVSNYDLLRKPGYNEPRLWRKNMTGAELFILNEFHYISVKKI